MSEKSIGKSAECPSKIRLNSGTDPDFEDIEDLKLHVDSTGNSTGNSAQIRDFDCTATDSVDGRAGAQGRRETLHEYIQRSRSCDTNSTREEMFQPKRNSLDAYSRLNGGLSVQEQIENDTLDPLKRRFSHTIEDAFLEQLPVVKPPFLSHVNID